MTKKSGQGYDEEKWAELRGRKVGRVMKKKSGQGFFLSKKKVGRITTKKTASLRSDWNHCIDKA